MVAPTATAQLKHLGEETEDRDTALPEEIRDLGQMYLAQIAGLNARVAELDQKMKAAAKEADVASRFQTRTGAGPITGLAIETFAPDLAACRRGRDFAAWFGRVLKQHSIGGETRLGKTSNMGQRDIRTLLVSGALAVLQAVERFGTRNNGWRTRLRSQKPGMVVPITLANKLARGLWAMMTNQEDYRNPVATMV